MFFKDLYLSFCSSRNFCVRINSFAMDSKAALNVVPPLRAQSAELAQADSGARKCGIKPERSGARRSQLRLTACSGTFKYC